MKQYLDLFTEQRLALDAHAPAMVNAWRDRAAASLAALGMPTRRDEDFRYTDVAAALRPDYGMNVGTAGVASLDAVAQEQVGSRYATVAQVGDDPLVALNTMLTQDVVVVHARRGEQLRRHLRLNNPQRQGVPMMAHRRVLIVADEDSRLCVGIDDVAQGTAADVPMLTTLVVEVVARRGSTVELYECERTDACNRRFANVCADIEEGAHFIHAAMTLSPGTTRNRLRVRLLGEGAECHLQGCAVEYASQHVDSNTLIEHLAPRCTSRQLYRYVLDEAAQGAFAGRIYVAHGAVGTDSVETNANLVCTPEARMWTQPMLEIYADDVRCSHGATVGQLSADALFYMQQRGLSADEARTLLKQAFAAYVVESIPDSVTRERYAALLNQHFAAQAVACRTCQRCK